MKKLLNLCFKLLLVFICLMGVVMALAYIMGVKYPIGRQLRPVPGIFLQMYEQKRSVEEQKIRAQNLAKLATTGIGDGCDFSARRGDEENKDLYHAIKTAKDNKRAISLVDAEMFGVSLDGVDLSEANLSGANLIGAHLQKANLSGAFFARSRLSLADLSGANLTGANLMLADLTVAMLNEADLTGASLYEAVLIMTDVSQANLSNASLRQAVIYSIHSENTKFVGASFQYARIINTFASSADFTDARFDGWIMYRFNQLILWVILIKQGLMNKWFS